MNSTDLSLSHQSQTRTHRRTDARKHAPPPPPTPHTRTHAYTQLSAPTHTIARTHENMPTHTHPNTAESFYVNAKYTCDTLIQLIDKTKTIEDGNRTLPLGSLGFFFWGGGGIIYCWHVEWLVNTLHPAPRAIVLYLLFRTNLFWGTIRNLFD